MSKLTFERILVKNYINFRGKSLHKRYVIIESDDWGAQRTFDVSALKNLSAAGIPIENNLFDYNDSIETSDDLELLFEVLSSVKDQFGNSAVITPLSIVANPNFEEIESNGYSKYVYESVLNTYKRQSSTERSFDIIQEGIRAGVFYPQFHGREHIHVKRYMQALNSGSKKEKLAFENRSIIGSELYLDSELNIPNYFTAFGFDDRSEIADLESIADDGILLFENIYGYKPISFCPSCGVVDTNYLATLGKYGIIGIQCGQYFVPSSNNRVKVVNRFWGDKTPVNQVFWRRNCTFEPYKDHNKDWIDSCIAEMAIAFKWGKPAVINSHRVNYIGCLHPQNRDYTLRSLVNLLRKIIQIWPDVEFVNSERLARELILL